MVKGHMGQGQPKNYNIGRWAHVNVKMLHLDQEAFINNGVIMVECA